MAFHINIRLLDLTWVTPIIDKAQCCFPIPKIEKNHSVRMYTVFISVFRADFKSGLRSSKIFSEMELSCLFNLNK